MSRIGKMPITIPAGVKIEVSNDNIIKVKGAKGELFQKVDTCISVDIEDSQLKVNRESDSKPHRAMHGLYRSLIFNMVEGVSKGYVREMELIGVGYRANNTGNLLELTVGYSHPILFYVPDDVVLTTEMKKGSPPLIRLEGIDKQLVGQVAAKIRAFRRPEPYKGKGIRFKGEEIRRKAGKAAGK